MTITFKCPHCKSLCAFNEKHIGRSARCLSCQNKFVIPLDSDTKAEKIKEKPDKPLEPKPGFYQAVFIDTWTAFKCKNSLDSFFHLTVLVVLKYIFGTCAFSLGRGGEDGFGFLTIFIVFATMVLLLCYIGVWGALMKFYMSVITETALGADEIEVPDRYEGFSFWHNHFKPFFVFMLTVFSAFIPLVIALMIYDRFGIERPLIYSKDMNILQVLAVIGIFLIPICLIAICVMKDFVGLRPDNLIKPIIKSFFPYLVVVGLFGLAFYLESLTGIKKVNNWDSSIITVQRMVADVFIHIPIIWAMRSAGLFYRHYNCHFVY